MNKILVIVSFLLPLGCRSLDNRSDLSIAPYGSVTISTAGRAECDSKKEKLLEDYIKQTSQGVQAKLRLVARNFDIARATMLIAIEYERLTGKKISCAEVYKKIGHSNIIKAMEANKPVSIDGKVFNARQTAVADVTLKLNKILSSNPQAAVGIVDAAIFEAQARTSMLVGSTNGDPYFDRRVSNAMLDTLKIVDNALKGNRTAQQAAPHSKALNIAIETIRVATGQVSQAEARQAVVNVSTALTAASDGLARTSGQQGRKYKMAVAGAVIDFEATSTLGRNSYKMASANPTAVGNRVAQVLPDVGQKGVETMRLAAGQVASESAKAHGNNFVRSKATRYMYQSMTGQKYSAGSSVRPPNFESTVAEASRAYEISNRYNAFVAREYKAGRRGYRYIVNRRTGAKGIR